MHAHIPVIIQYYLAFNSDWLFACYFVIIFSLVATALCYSSILVSVTHRLILMNVKVCYARLAHQNLPKHAFLNKRLKNFLPHWAEWGGGYPLSTPRPYSAPRGTQTECLDPPLLSGVWCDHDRSCRVLH